MLETTSLPSCCIVIPCYNEVERFPQQAFWNYFEQSTQYFCLVNDGSKDGTLDMLQSLEQRGRGRILVVDQQPNSGKAEAVRQGMLAARDWCRAEWFGYFDADLATPLEEIPYLLANVAAGDTFYRMVFGARVKLLGWHIERKVVRHYFGRVFATLASSILGIPVYDTQCGAKILSRELIDIAFDKSFLSPWLFDIEIFARLICHFGRSETAAMLLEVPLRQWIEMGDSRIKMKDLLRVPFQLIQIRYYYFSKKGAARNRR